MEHEYYYIVGAVVVLIIALAYAYEKQWLNDYLPATWAKADDPAKTTFVGAYGHSPGMQGCVSNGFNRCTYA